MRGLRSTKKETIGNDDDDSILSIEFDKIISSFYKKKLESRFSML